MMGGLGLRIPESFDRDLRLLMYSMSLRRLSMGFLQVVRAIYFALLGFSPMKVGFLLSIATFVSAIYSIVVGFLSDRYGRKPFILLGGFFATLRMVILAISSDFWLLALAQGVGALGEGAGAGQPVVSAYISDKSDVLQRPKIFSTLAITNEMAATVGTLLSGLPAYLQHNYGLDMIPAHSMLFWIGAVSSVISFLIALPMKEVKAKKVKEQKDQGQDAGIKKAKSWGVIARFSLVRSTSGVGWSLIQSLMPLYFYMQFGIGSEVLGLIYAVTRVLSVLSYTMVPRIVGRFGEVSSLIGSRIISAILAAAFSLATWYPLAVLFMIALRVTVMFTMPIRQTLATSIVDPDETATAIGISSFARMSLRSIAPALAGYMFEAISLSMPFLLGAGLLAANGVLYKVFFHPSKKDDDFRDSQTAIPTE